MPFLTEPEPQRGIPLSVLPGIRRVVARNPSVMTYQGTNTYLIEVDDALVVIDPGPKDMQHVQEVLAAAGSTPIRHIVLTHTHSDHWGAAAALAKATGAPIASYKISEKAGFEPDIALDDGETVAGLTALHTPGHAADHLCFEHFLPDGTKILFSGDHVMSWSSSIVSPPDGDMLAYYRSLELLLARDEVVYLGGHGPLLADPRVLVRELLEHRQFRERTILAELKQQEWVVAALSAKLYDKTDPFLKAAAQRNVLAHMLKLKAEGFVEEHEPDTTPHPDTMLLTPPPGVQDESGGEFAAMRADALRRFGMAGMRAL
jgi:glyoxylase-like metal-dependent hydrolase (beta-lactamase superfamily II)